MKPQLAIPLIVVGFLLAVVWKSPSGSAEFLRDVLSGLGSFLTRLANTIATFLGGLTS